MVHYWKLKELNSITANHLLQCCGLTKLLSTYFHIQPTNITNITNITKCYLLESSILIEHIYKG